MYVKNSSSENLSLSLATKEDNDTLSGGPGPLLMQCNLRKD